GHHLFREPSLWLGFCFSATGLSIELRSIIRRNAAHPFGASATSALFNACGVSPSPGTTYSENPAYGWVFAFLRPTANRRPDKHSAIRHSMPIVFTFNFSHRLFITNAGLQFGCDILH
ncbi:hypothetical protein, partial [Klebsiella aerogenes]|uniref:hypothetical protein n=1 Tax=Klebsiella aerogenes TaxID=548 RepID=UPI003978DAAC